MKKKGVLGFLFFFVWCMDAVELPLPVDVATAPKLMGSEGFGRAGVPVKDEDPRPPRPYSSSIECCNSRLVENGEWLSLFPFIFKFYVYAILESYLFLP